MKKRWITILLCLFIAWGWTVPIFAETPDTEQTEIVDEKKDKEKEEKKEKKKKPKDFSSIVAPYAIVMDLESGYILFEKESTVQAVPGDLVKMMTALLVVENCDMNDIITVSQTVLDSVDVYNDTTIELEVGEQVAVQDMLYAMLLPSADDAAIALAEHVSGDEATFVEQMNHKAQELGMTRTVFTNATGIAEEGQYSTAKDMAILARAVMNNDLLAKAVGAELFEFSATNTRPDPTTYFNNNYLVSAYTTPHYFYDNALGIKNGYTDEGRYTLAAAASNGSGEVIAVVMGNERDEDSDEITSYNDCITIFDYVFQNYSYTTIINTNQIIAEYDVPNAKGDGHVLLLCPTTKESFLPNTFSMEDITFNVNLNRELTAPIEKGEVLGTA
ncbi:MAG: D-alanyl-D-alanine carboxypeptidase, partial [Ruminococcaceae bacterium]|nr:D-alanyl-D-alanine carboxypeptidase [Oscillospiraceae bacterium]